MIMNVPLHIPSKNRGDDGQFFDQEQNNLPLLAKESLQNLSAFLSQCQRLQGSSIIARELQSQFQQSLETVIHSWLSEHTTQLQHELSCYDDSISQLSRLAQSPFFSAHQAIPELLSQIQQERTYAQQLLQSITTSQNQTNTDRPSPLENLRDSENDTINDTVNDTINDTIEGTKLLFPTTSASLSVYPRPTPDTRRDFPSTAVPSRAIPSHQDETNRNLDPLNNHLKDVSVNNRMEKRTTSKDAEILDHQIGLQTFKDEAPKSNSVTSLLHSAHSAYLAKNYSQAENYCQQVLEKEPESIKALTLLGMIFQEQKLWQVAIHHLIEAINLGSQELEPRIQLGNAYASQGNHHQAVEIYKQILQSSPRQIKVRFNYAVCLAILKQYQASLAEFLHVIREQPSWASAYFQCGLVYLELNNHPKARDAFQMVLKLQPGHLTAQKKMALLAQSSVSISGNQVERLSNQEKHLDNIPIDSKEHGSRSEDHSELLNNSTILRSNFRSVTTPIIVDGKSTPQHEADPTNNSSATSCTNNLRTDYGKELDQDRLTSELITLPTSLYTQQVIPSKVGNRSSEKGSDLTVSCPNCQWQGIVKWNRLNRIFNCPQCHQHFAIRPDGRTVEVVKSEQKGWIEKSNFLRIRSNSRRKNWIRLGIPGIIIGIFLFLSWGFLFHSQRSRIPIANQLPKEFEARVELFTRAWIKKDYAILRKLTATSHDRVLYGWYQKHQPPPLEEEARKTLLEKPIIWKETDRKEDLRKIQITFSLASTGTLPPDTTAGTSNRSIHLIQNWVMRADQWFFIPPG